MQLGAAAFGGDAASGSVALSCRGLSKSFPGVRALSDATLEIAEGEVRALVGSNGAGKSTLIKIIMGVNQRDGGELSLWGEPVLVDSVKEARSRGVAAVYQELSLVPSMTVAENIAIGRWGEFERFRWIVDTRRMRAHARDALETLGVDINVDAEAGHWHLRHDFLSWTSRQVRSMLTRSQRCLRPSRVCASRATRFSIFLIGWSNFARWLTT
jgi:ABC-type sugar transport system ATPase subunit